MWTYEAIFFWNENYPTSVWPTCKKILKGKARNYYRKLSKHAALEVNFSEMNEEELLQLYTLDNYESNYYRFEVSNYTIVV